MASYTINGNDKSDNEILEALKLDYPIKSSVHRFGDFGQFKSNKTDVYRDLPNGQAELIGTYADRNPRQNIDMLHLIQDIFEASGQELTGVRSGGKHSIIGVGQDVSVSKKLADQHDSVSARMIIRDSHNPNEGLGVSVEFTRLVCLNGMVQDVQNRVGVVNHQSNSVNLGNLEKVMLSVTKLINTQARIFEKMAEVQVSEIEARRILIKEFGTKSKVTDLVMAKFKGEGIGANLQTAQGTGFGLLNAVTEYYNHDVAAKASNDLQEAQNQRFLSILHGSARTRIDNIQRVMVAGF
jgi:hypothetical protein